MAGCTVRHKRVPAWTPLNPHGQPRGRHLPPELASLHPPLQGFPSRAAVLTWGHPPCTRSGRCARRTTTTWTTRPTRRSRLSSARRRAPADPPLRLSPDRRRRRRPASFADGGCTRKDPLEELARLAEQLRPEPRARWRPGPLPVALLGLLLVAAGAFAATRLSGRRPALGEAAAPPIRRRARLGGSPWTAELPRRPPPPTPTPPDRAAPPTQGPRSDAKAIDEDLEREFGSGRPTIPGPALPSAAPLPSWVKEVADAPRRATPAPAPEGSAAGTATTSGSSSGAPSTAGSAAPGPWRRCSFAPTSWTAPWCCRRGRWPSASARRVGTASSSPSAGSGFRTERRRQSRPWRSMPPTGSPGCWPPGASRATGRRRRDSLGGEIARGAASTVLSAGTAAAGLPGQLVNSAGQTAINDRPAQPRCELGGRAASRLEARGGPLRRADVLRRAAWPRRRNFRRRTPTRHARDRPVCRSG